MPLIAFSGNRFLAEEALRDTLAARGLNVRDLPRLAGEEISAEAVAPLLAPSLFGDGGLIVDFAGMKPDKALLELLAAAPVTVAVLDEAPPATRVKLYEGRGEYHPSPTPQKTSDVAGWVAQRARKTGLKLDRDAALYLAEVFGSDLTGIAGELNKLALLDPPLTADLVRRVVGREPPGDTFALLGAATGGRPAEAVTQLRRLLATGEDPFKLLGAVVWQYNLVARCVALLQEEGRVTEQVAAQRLGVKPYPAKKALEVARRLNEPKIRAHLGRILDADLGMKRGLDPATTLERLIVQLSVEDRCLSARSGLR
ncbi:DNA polymerase III, delta subunit [Deinococcus geothermalis DSM 11300]|uniref:DNA-directed DNA polymerase n=1 Tax=Deinococcus geothermalis (strain DSM 11300 / CIP 105573 / AG-3a) TaxID=319795 RepID=Q1J0D7_DEIGD|nr:MULTISPECIES: DNA polymerase III subunit delta [Deinococcus]ABF45047.1 DNA polymerase III, delta subunit [Deinococcus geothermalis DSM 11300]TDE87544.1 DNA polymerase III subunit delta [Deinococcus sp. S9]